MRRRRGLSLLETLVTALLVSVALTVVANIMAEFNRVLSLTEQRDTGLTAMLALRKVSGELQETVNVTSPRLGSTSALLTFQRIDPTYPGRIPAVLLPTPSPMPGSWEPKDTAYLVKVTYSVTGSRQLLRRATFPGGSYAEQVCADSVLSFSGDHTGRGVVLLTLRVSQGTLHLTTNLQASEVGP